MENFQKPLLSIIIPTIGRIEELISLLESIYSCDIDHSQVEIIVIDQNSISFLKEVRLKFESVRFENVDFKGLSKAKNYGATLANGKWLCFPDDDCEFFNDTIKLALRFLYESNAEIIFGKCIDRSGNDSVMNFKNQDFTLTVETMSGGFVEATGFVKKEVFSQYKFDESMGAGCFHGAEEGYDWLFRILKNSKYKVIFNPLILFYHPQIISVKGDQASIKRVFTYRCGFAKLCFKHEFYFKFFKRVVLVSFSLPFFAFFDQKKLRYYSAELLGLFSGAIIK